MQLYEIIIDFVNLIYTVFFDVLEQGFQIDISSIDLSIALFSDTPILEISLGNLIIIIITFVIWYSMIKITFNILKGLYRRIRGQ